MASDEDITIESAVNIPSAGKGIKLGEIVPLTAISSALTDIGHNRLHNEDAYYQSDSKGLWLVCDGMGGHNAGDYASQSVVSEVAVFQPNESMEESIEHLERIIHQTNRNLIKKASDQPNTIIGTTIALLYAKDNQGILLWAGDSRVYRIRDNVIEQLTEDHSLVNEMIKLGEITPEEAEAHPDYHKITRAIGYSEEFSLDFRKLSVLPGDRYIICSDGLHNKLTDNNLLSIAKEETAETCNRNLVQTALDTDSRDNITSVTIDFFKG